MARKETAEEHSAPRQLSPKTRLANLKKEAKRWLKALQARDEEAERRLLRAYPDAPSEPKLRYVQHGLALEHGFSGWEELKKNLESLSVSSVTAGSPSPKTELVDQFLEYACADPILNNGPAAHLRRERAALRILTRYPQIAHSNIHTAVVCGDLEEVERILRDRPEAAIEPGGPQRRRHLSRNEKLWTPLLHLCYGRLPTPAASRHSAAIAEALLDAGANPNDYFEVGSHPCRYTALCGVAGEGEDDAPPQPQKEALARLLMERGAEPYDIQVFYNTHFHSEILWLMELVYEFSVKAGRLADWEDPEWSMIDMGGYDLGARYLLLNAIKHNKLRLVEWLLEHGANPNAMPKPTSRFPRRSLHEVAIRLGFTDIADLLVRHGAIPSTTLALDAMELFTAACFQLDRPQALALLQEHPEYLNSHEPIFAAARRDRADVVEFLLDLGVSIEVEDASKQRPLHEAAGHDSLNVAKLLIERGAELEPVETNWSNTPLDHAMYGNLDRMVQFLSGFTRDVFRLTWIGNVDRLREVLSEEPERARVSDNQNTPLMWLPDDEVKAVECVNLLMACGADPAIGNKDGLTAADLAEKRGLYDAAELLRSI
jgi:uncharacterized protein